MLPVALRWSEARNCGLCVVYIQKDGAILLVNIWCMFICHKSIKLTKFNKLFCRANVLDWGEVEISVFVNNCQLSVASRTTLA